MPVKYTKQIVDRSGEIGLVNALKLIFEDNPAHFENESTILAAYYRFTIGDKDAQLHSAGTFLRNLYDGTYFNPFSVLTAWFDMQEKNTKYRSKNYDQTRIKFIALLQRYAATDADEMEGGNEGEDNSAVH